MAGKTYKVIVVGAGKRGKHHAAAFKANPRFEVAGLADVMPSMLEKAAAELGVKRTSADPLSLAREVKPDVFCFCTPPSIRLELIKTGIDSGAKLIAYEKPIALSMNEALEIRQAVRASGVKTVVSHQHRYGEHYAKVRQIIASGALGRLHTVYATGPGWFFHMLTHFIEYIRWFADYPAATWVMAQAAGKGKLADNHPSPDYIAGFIQFANGVRGIVECGAGAPDVPEAEAWWRKNRIGAQGSEGFAELMTDGGWRAVTKRDGWQSGSGKMNYDQDMPAYIQEMADWLDDDRKIHPCHGDRAYEGLEICMALARSAAGGGQVKLPLGPGDPEIESFKKALPDAPVLLGFEGSRKEYPYASP